MKVTLSTGEEEILYDRLKKADDKPMVIHTKEKPEIHVKGASEAKIKGRNILTVQHGPKIAGSVAEKSMAADGNK